MEPCQSLRCLHVQSVAITGELDLKLDIFFWHGLEVNYCVIVSFSCGTRHDILVRAVPTCTQIRMCIQIEAASIRFSVTAKPVSYGHSKQTKNDLNDKW